MSKLNASQLSVLTSIKDAKKATKKVATANAGNAVTVQKLIDAKLVTTNAPTKKQPEVTYSVTTEGKAALRAAATAAAKAAKSAKPVVAATA